MGRRAEEAKIARAPLVPPSWRVRSLVDLCREQGRSPASKAARALRNLA